MSVGIFLRWDFSKNEGLWDFLLVSSIVSGWGISSYNNYQQNISLALIVYLCDAMYLADKTARLAKSFPDIMNTTRHRLRSSQWLCNSTYFLVAMATVLLISLTPYHVCKIASPYNSLTLYLSVCLARCCYLLVEGRPKIQLTELQKITTNFCDYFISICRLGIKARANMNKKRKRKRNNIVQSHEQQEERIQNARGQTFSMQTDKECERQILVNSKHTFYELKKEKSSGKVFYVI